MAEKIVKTKEKNQRRKTKSQDFFDCSEGAYSSFALIKNSGVLPFKKPLSVAVVECVENRQIKTAKVLFDAISSFIISPFNAFVTHSFATNSQKIDVKTTFKAVKKSQTVILYIGAEVATHLDEIVALAKIIKKSSTLILCFHKCNKLYSHSLLSFADAVFVGFNSSKEEGKALFNIIWGKQTPYAKICMNNSEPLEYVPLCDKIKNQYDDYGVGLSYINLSYTNARLSIYNAKVGEKVVAKVDISNYSSLSSFEIPQLYIARSDGSMQLHSISPVRVPSLSTVTATFEIDTAQIDFGNETDYKSQVFVCVGKSSKDTVKIPLNIIF